MLEKLKLGQVDSIEYGVEQIIDEFMIYGLRGGLIGELSKSFPDPRKDCEITVKQILYQWFYHHITPFVRVWVTHTPTG